VDFKPTRYKKGDLVRLKKYSHDQPATLGIIMEQDAAKVKVHWIIRPEPSPKRWSWDTISLHTIEPVEKV